MAQCILVVVGLFDLALCCLWSCGTDYKSICVVLLQRRLSVRRLCANTETFSAPRCEQINPGASWGDYRAINLLLFTFNVFLKHVSRRLCSSFTCRKSFRRSGRNQSHNYSSWQIQVVLEILHAAELYWKLAESQEVDLLDLIFKLLFISSAWFGSNDEGKVKSSVLSNLTADAKLEN